MGYAPSLSAIRRIKPADNQRVLFVYLRVYESMTLAMEQFTDGPGFGKKTFNVSTMAAATMTNYTILKIDEIDPNIKKEDEAKSACKVYRQINC